MKQNDETRKFLNEARMISSEDEFKDLFRKAAYISKKSFNSILNPVFEQYPEMHPKNNE